MAGCVFWTRNCEVKFESLSSKEFRARRNRDQMKFDQTTKVALVAHSARDILNLFLIETCSKWDTFSRREKVRGKVSDCFSFCHTFFLSPFQFKVKQLISSINDLCAEINQSCVRASIWREISFALPGRWLLLVDAMSSSRCLAFYAWIFTSRCSSFCFALFVGSPEIMCFMQK